MGLLRKILNQGAHPRNRRMLGDAERLYGVMQYLDDLGVRIRHFENKSTTMPIVEIEYAAEVAQLRATHLRGVHFYSVMNGVRIEWVHPETSIQVTP